MGSLYAYDCGGNVSYSSQQNLNRRPNKKIKDPHKSILLPQKLQFHNKQSIIDIMIF